MSFQRMERVVFYSNGKRLKGFISEFIKKTPQGNVFKVICDEKYFLEEFITVHEKQCRKLVKKKRREFWLMRDRNTGFINAYSVHPVALNNALFELIKVVEVKK